MDIGANELKESDFVRILWDYFSTHATQRMQILNFFIVLETFFITALLALFQFKIDFKVLRITLSIAIIFFSLIFNMLDKRTRQMIKYSEEALKSIEQKYINKYGKDIMIFTIEEEKTSIERKNREITKPCLSYTQLFKLTFCFFFLIGVIGFCFEIYLIIKSRC